MPSHEVANHRAGDLVALEGRYLIDLDVLSVALVLAADAGEDPVRHVLLILRRDLYAEVLALELVDLEGTSSLVSSHADTAVMEAEHSNKPFGLEAL